MDSRNLFLVAALSGLAFAAAANDTAPVPATVMPTAHMADEAPVAVKATALKGKTNGNLSLEGNCHGVNSCHTATNTCQGKGFEKMSEKACKEKKGIFKRE